MVDRVIDLPDDSGLELIRANGFQWFLDGENEEYVTTEALLLSRDESKAFLKAADECFDLYIKAMEYVITGNLWSRIGIPEAAIPLIKYSWDQKHPHILGRFDFAGGIEGTPIKLIEFNADTCTSLPESAYFQDWLQEPVRTEYKGQVNYLVSDVEKELRSLRSANPDLEPTLLLTSLGYIEDQLNMEVIKEAAQNAGFQVAYANLEEVIFDEDAVLLEVEGGYAQYHFVFKLIPWEFIIFEEPELLGILSDLIMNHGLVVINPAYSLVFQSKRLMSILYKLFPYSEYLLSTYDDPSHFSRRAYVEKVNFGRLGENIRIFDNTGKVIEENDGDFNQEQKIYQELASMYRDEDNDIYQAGVFVSGGTSNCISFRRRDGLIIDDDAEFISHLLF